MAAPEHANETGLVYVTCPHCQCPKAVLAISPSSEHRCFCPRC